MMRRSQQVTANVEEVADESMHGQESLCLPGRSKPAPPKEDSRLTVNIQLGLGIAGKLQASSDNCAVEALVRPLADAKRLCKSIFLSPRVNGWFTIDQQ